jgi:hypothetical protein
MAVELTGFQKPLNPAKTKAVGLAVVNYGQAADRHVAECSCGWATWHRRLKVLDDKIDKHINAKHNGRGIRV